MKRYIHASDDTEKIISGVHCIVESKYGGFVNDKVFNGTKSQLLNKAAQLFEEYVANPEDRFIVLLCKSNISYTEWSVCTSSDDFYEAEEIASDWVDPNKQPVARESIMQLHYYASVVDTVRCREIFYDTAWQRTEEK